MQVDERTLVLGAVAVGLLVLLLRSAVGRWWRGVRARRRARRALAGEERAVRLLRRRGFRVEGAQVPGSFMIEVDGRPHEVALRADLLVTRRGKRYVAEVKTGAQAPRPGNRATRRQLLEYRVAYAADGVLLVDMERSAVHEVRFPTLPRQRRLAGLPMFVALVAAAILGATAVTLGLP